MDLDNYISKWDIIGYKIPSYKTIETHFVILSFA